MEKHIILLLFNVIKSRSSRISKMIWLTVCLSLHFGSYASGSKPVLSKIPQTDTSENVIISISANHKDGVYSSNEKVSYTLKLKSTYKEVQDGKISYVLLSDFGKKIYESSAKAHIGREGAENFSFDLPQQPSGAYQVAFRLNFTSYDDTVKRVFIIAPKDIKAATKKPADFDTFWKRNKASLTAVDPKYKITEDPVKGDKYTKVYLVEMHSYNNVIIRGWLSVPKSKPHKIPVRYRLPGYVVALEPSLNDADFAVFNLNTRGSGNSKDAVKIDGEFNYHHLMNRDEYIYKGVYLDCIRGLDFIFDNAQRFGLDTMRVAADGGSQGGCLALVTASLDPRIKLVTAELPLYSDLRDAIHIGPVLYPEKKSPVWMLYDYSKQARINEEVVLHIWDYYDPVNFAANIKCPVLMAISLLDELVPPRCSFALFNQLGSKKKEYWVNANLTHEVDAAYYQYQNIWLEETLRLP